MVGHGPESGSTAFTVRKTVARIVHATPPTFEYIEVFYNCQRIHSSIGYVSPEQFETGRRWYTRSVHWRWASSPLAIQPVEQKRSN